MKYNTVKNKYIDMLLYRCTIMCKRKWNKYTEVDKHVKGVLLLFLMSLYTNDEENLLAISLFRLKIA